MAVRVVRHARPGVSAVPWLPRSCHPAAWPRSALESEPASDDGGFPAMNRSSVAQSSWPPRYGPLAAHSSARARSRRRLVALDPREDRTLAEPHRPATADGRYPARVRAAGPGRVHALVRVGKVLT